MGPQNSSEQGLGKAFVTGQCRGCRGARSDRRSRAASGKIKAAAEPLNSIGSIRSPEASWFHIKQLTEPLSADGEFISTRPIQTMTKHKNYIIVDIAKDSLQVQASDYACALTYEEKGLKKLLSILRKQPKGCIFICEATGALLDLLEKRKLPYAHQ